MFSADDHRFMQLALDLAKRGLNTTTPNPRVGAVLVRDGEVIGSGFTQPPGFAHAEVAAIDDAKKNGHDPRGSSAYVTLEPCSHFGKTPPCALALIDAGVSRVIAAMEDPNPLVSGQGFDALRNAGIEVRCGLLEAEARMLNLGFVSRMLRKRPWVRVKAAASLDGRTALANGVSRWITSEDARRDGHAWRARACAVLTGIGTVRADDPMLDVRLVETTRQPPRLVLDARLDIGLETKLVQTAKTGSQVTVFTTQNDPVKVAELGARGCEVVQIAAIDGKIDLSALLLELGSRQINELHVEAGARLNGALLAAGLVDELLIYMAPCLIGPGEPIAVLAQIERLADRQSLEFTDVEQIGHDIRVVARFADMAWLKDK
jgi:diaminohydroxyphosphoribosylaminopyrimidine deaminase / 5-amino-6-(5-phosphoribosylamino)uracil reductase